MSLVDNNLTATVELNSIDAQTQLPHVSQMQMQQMQMQQMQHMQHMQHMQMQPLPQHLQDPHATAGVPGYPYPPPQYYPMYMNPQVRFSLFYLFKLNLS